MFKSMDAVRQTLAQLRQQPDAWVSTGAWSLGQVLVHAAQSIEYSMDGYPQLKPGWFRHTVGPAALAVFKARGRMSHSLSEPIPGAPSLDAAFALEAAAQRLLAAMDRFEAHTGAFAPHFAYGELGREGYQHAHLMHLNNHWQEVRHSS
jgi:hypothetical protein